MKVIGLIGGTSWTSTVEYYRIINEVVGQRLGGLHSARLVLCSLDFSPLEQAMRQSRWDDVGSSLTEAGLKLKEAGADFILICTNTMHKVADAIEPIRVPRRHLPALVVQAVEVRQLL